MTYKGVNQKIYTYGQNMKMTYITGGKDLSTQITNTECVELKRYNYLPLVAPKPFL